MLLKRKERKKKRTEIRKEKKRKAELKCYYKRKEKPEPR